MVAENIRTRALEKLEAQLINDLVREMQSKMVSGDGTMPSTEEQLELVGKALKTTLNSVPEPVRDPIAKYYNEIDNLAKQDFIKTKIGTIDNKLGGLEEGNLITICGLPGHGKSALSTQIAVNTAKQGYKTAYLSLEMTHKQLMDRLARHAGVDIPQQRLRCGKLQKDDWEDLSRHLNRMDSQYLHNLDVFTQEDSEGIQTIPMLRKMIQTYKPKIVVIDQLNKLEINGRFAGEFERLQDITKQLKVLAKTERIIIILQAQINSKSQFNEDDGPREANIANSKAMLEESDILMVVYRYPGQVDPTGTELERQKVKVNVLKNRQGISGPVELEFVGSRFRFDDIIPGYND